MPIEGLVVGRGSFPIDTLTKLFFLSTFELTVSQSFKIEMIPHFDDNAIAADVV